MYASTNHVYGDYTVTDYRNVSRQAAERHARLAAVKESRTQRVEQQREARRQARHTAVTAGATA